MVTGSCFFMSVVKWVSFTDNFYSVKFSFMVLFPHDRPRPRPQESGAVPTNVQEQEHQDRYSGILEAR